jgi:PAS domain S-box-containing protein/diguanylate cyclase (GGDEF)-like protein
VVLTVTGQQRKGDIVSDETLSRAGLPRRIELLTRQHGLLEASVPVAEGQALAPYLNSRSAGVELADVTVVATGETHEKLVLRQADVIHARPVEAHVPVVLAQPEGGEDVAVEVTLGSGDVVRGSFIMAPGQTIGEHLGSSGTFAVLTKARADGRATPPTELAVNQYAMQRIRDVGETPTRHAWQRDGTAAPAARADWLLGAAREHGILSAFEHAADAVFLTDREGVIQWVNHAFVELSGYQPAEAIGRRPNILRSDRQDADFFRGVWETILSGSLWRGELYNQRSDGSAYAVEQTITPVLNRDRVITHFLSVQRDITERKQRESKVHQLLTRDPMSGLPNGRAFERELQNAVAAVAKGRAPAALLLIQAEGVAASANATAHDDAEALARLLATTLRSTLRPEDTLARLGDFEFAALLPDTTADGAVVAAERLRAAATARFAEDAQGRGIVRLGIAPIDGSHGARAVLAVADAALYGEHNEASDIVARVSANAASGIAAEWADRIRAAVRGGLFFLHYQPVVRLSTGAVAHYDGLLRLHDERGHVVPARAFITHAESLGLMPEIDRWVVEHVMRLLQDSPDLCVSLNVSGATISSASFRQFVQSQSRRMAAVGARMIFEVGEVGSVEELPRLVDGMNHLRELGCRFTLDNFSLTAASVASLGALPVDYAKLDRSLVTGIDVDENRFELTRALTAVARALGREVIAGCAERASIVDVLPALGIDMAQGHYFGAPAAELRRHVGGNGRSADALLLATAGNATPGSN